jgi:Protein of unknown function (DUF2927)
MMPSDRLAYKVGPSLLAMFFPKMRQGHSMETCGPQMLPSCRGKRDEPETFVRRASPRQPAKSAGSSPRRPARWGLVTLWVSLVILAMARSAVEAEDGRIATGRSSERLTFSDAEIAEGFFKIAFGAELHVAGDANRIRKFDRPVRVFLDNRAQANRRADIAAVISDIRTYVDHLDIRLTDDRKAANIVVTLVRNHSELLRTMRSLYGRKRADEIERRLAPRCLSGFSENAEHRIKRAEVLLTADGGDFGFLDCAYEELLQALGPINDDRSVPWTMFNDDVQMGFFDVYDQYILNILYDPRVRPGMTRQDIDLLLPDILPKVHTWISRINAARRPGANGEELAPDGAARGSFVGWSQPEGPQSGPVAKK